MRMREVLLPVPNWRRHPHLLRRPYVLRALPQRLRLQDFRLGNLVLGDRTRRSWIRRRHPPRRNALRGMHNTKRHNQELPERDPELRNDNQAQLDELGDDPAEVGPDSAGQSGGSEGLSGVEEASDENVEELAGTGQAIESMHLRAANMPRIIRRSRCLRTKTIQGRHDVQHPGFLKLC